MRTTECQNARPAVSAPAGAAKGASPVSVSHPGENRGSQAPGARTVIAIDPGTEESGYVSMRGGKIIDFGVCPNCEVEEWLSGEAEHCHHAGIKDVDVVIEWLGSYGMPVGQSVFHTCRWVGRFEAAWGDSATIHLMERRNVKMHLCNKAAAKDSNVWQAVMDRYGSERAKAIGTKKAPGPLYGITKDARQALALAVAWTELQAEEVTR